MTDRGRSDRAVCACTEPFAQQLAAFRGKHHSEDCPMFERDGDTLRRPGPWEVLCAAVDLAVHRHVLDARSVVADVRLDQSEELPLMTEADAISVLERAGYLR